MESLLKLRRRHLVKAEPISAIARDLNLARNTVKKYLKAETEPVYQRSHQPCPKLGKYRQQLETWLEQDGQRPKAQRRTARRLYEDLQREGYAGAYDSVQRFVKQWKGQAPTPACDAYVPLSFPPGETCQFDWSHEQVELGGVVQTVKLAHFRLAHSRQLFLAAYPRETQEMVFDAHNRAFAFLGGVPERMVYDNPKTIVQTLLTGKERRFNRRFLALANHYLFEPVACTPASGWEKGQVENQVGNVREWLFTPRPSFTDFSALNAWLEGRCRELAKRPHPEQKARPIADLFAEEQARLRPLYLKHAYNLSDEDVVARWAENVVWQYFSGQEYYEPRLPCDATQVGRFRTAIGEAGVEELLKATIDTAVETKAVRPDEFERIIVDSTVQEKAIAHPVDSRLLEIARAKVVQAAKYAGIALKQTFAKEGKALRRKAGGYAHAKQFRRLRRTVKRQRTILGIVLREVERKLGLARTESPTTISRLKTLMARAERIRTQNPKDKNKLYALHAPEVECIGKGKARKPYEFGVKASLAVTHKSGLMVGARTFPGNPYDGHMLREQVEQTTILLEDTGRRPKQVIVDLGYRGVDHDNPGIEIIHRGKYKSLSARQRRWLKRRQAIEPAIGHLKADHRMDRCWLPGQLGDSLHAVLCAAGYNLRWLLRAMRRLGLKSLCHLLITLRRWRRWGLFALAQRNWLVSLRASAALGATPSTLLAVG